MRAPMSETQPSPSSPNALSVMEAIFHRRAVRNYKADKIDPKTLRELFDAAVQAPTAMHEEPWIFAVVQDRALLNRISDNAKERIRADKQGVDTPQARHMLEIVNMQDFHIFYNANTLVLICCKGQEGPAIADCWLAAQNFMLAACSKGLGTCVIGLSLGELNTSKTKAELGLPEDLTVVAPMIVGVPAGETAVVPRKAPHILVWK